MSRDSGWIGTLLMLLMGSTLVLACNDSPDDPQVDIPDAPQEPLRIELLSPVMVNVDVYQLRFEVSGAEGPLRVAVALNDDANQEIEGAGPMFETDLTLVPRENELTIDVEHEDGRRQQLQTTLYFRANEALIAHFSMDGSMEVGEPVRFDASESKIPYGVQADYVWNLGDGTQRRGEMLAHSFETPGVYVVELEVRTEDGNSSVRLDNVAINGDEAALIGELEGVARSRDTGEIIEEVEVSIPAIGRMAQVDDNGEWRMSNLPVRGPLGVKVRAEGYLDRLVAIDLSVDHPRADLDVSMLAEQTQESGIIVDHVVEFGNSGARVIVEGDDYVNEAGEVITGDVEVIMTVIDPSTMADMLPGSSRALNYDGSWTNLLFSSAAHIEFFVNGVKAEPAAETRVELRLPLVAGEWHVGDHGARWTLLESLGIWSYEGTGSVVDGSSEQPLVLFDEGDSEHPYLIFDVTQSGWWAAAQEVLELASLELNCVIGAGFLRGDGPESSSADERPCFVVLNTEGWSRNVTTIEGAARHVDVPVKEICGTARARGGLCSSDFCIEIESSLNHSVEMELSCRDAQGELLTYGESRELIIDHAEGRELSNVYVFEGQAGDGVVVRLEHPSLNRGGGTLRLLNRRGQVLAWTSFSEEDAAVGLPLERDDLYLVEVELEHASSVAASVTLLNFSRIDFGEQVTGQTVEDAGGDYYMIEVYSEQNYVNIVHNEVSDLQLGIYNLLGEQTAVPIRGGWPTDIETGAFALPGPGVHLVGIQRNRDSPVSYEFSLIEIHEPVDLAFDGQGRAVVEETFDVHGENRFFRFNAEEGDGLNIDLFRSGEGALEAADQLGIQVYYLGDEEFPSFETRERTSSFDLGFFHQLDAWQFRAEHSGTYIIEIFHHHRSLSGVELGGFRLVVDRVRPFDEIMVGNPEECSEAQTHSLNAAARAAREGAEIVLCEGNFASELPVVIDRDGIRLTGQGRDESIVSFNHHRFGTPTKSAIIANARNLLVEDLTARYELTNVTVERGDALVSDELYRNGGLVADGLVLRNVDLIGSGGDYGVQNALRLYRSSNDVLVSEIYTDGTHQPIDIRKGDRVTVENSEIRYYHRGVSPPGPAAIYGNNLTDVDVWGNSVSGHGATCIQIYGAPSTENYGIRVEGNDCYRGIERVGISVNSGTGSGLGAREVVVKGNRLFSGRGADTTSVLRVVSNSPNTEVTVEGNDINASGGSGIRVQAPFIDVSEGRYNVLIANNVIRESGARWGVVHVDNVTENSVIDFFNNTLEVPEENVYYSEASLTLEPREHGLVANDLPIRVANNIFYLGAAGGAHAGVEFTGQNPMTIEADHNLYFNHGPRYVNVSNRLTSESHDVVGADPLFVGPDLQVESDSPAVDAGSCNYGPLTDVLGVARPQGGVCDIGAYEE